jgi:putative ABC transport system permease protein
VTKSRTDRLIRAHILLAAIKSRRGAASVLFVVAVIAIVAAAVGPMFLQSADTSVLTSTANAAPVGQTDILVITSGGVAQMRRLASATRDAEHVAHGLLSPAIFTADVGSHFVLKDQAYYADILARSDVCQHIRIVHGTCPDALNDVALSARSASTAHIGIGTRLKVGEPHMSGMAELTVTAIYQQPSNVADNYWRGNEYFDFGSGSASNIALDPLIGSFQTALAIRRIAVPQLSADLPWRVGATLVGPSVLESTFSKVGTLFSPRQGFTVSSGLPSVINTAQRDEDLMSTVVLIIDVQLILLSLVVLYALGKSSVIERRQDSEFARRHGFPRSALIALAIEEPATLLVAALPVGVFLAWGLLEVLTKTLFVSGTPVSIPGIAIAAAVGTCIAGVVAMLIASAELWRSQAHKSQQAKRAGIAIDAFAFAIALVGLISLFSRHSLSATKVAPLALLAPGLVTLGVAALGIPIVSLATRGAITRTRESSHVAWFLAVRQIGRRSAVLRRLFPLAMATAVLLFAVGCFYLAASNRSLVAQFDVGASKVVDVTVPPGFNLEKAVRRADPSGREAMAVANYSTLTGKLLAVDSSRLAAVADWPRSLSTPSLADLASKLSPSIPRGVSFSGDELRLAIGVEKGTPPIELGVSLLDENYKSSHTIYVGPIVPGVHSYTVSLQRVCSGVCRLEGLDPSWVNPRAKYTQDVLFTLSGVQVRVSGRWSEVDFGAQRSGTWQAQPSTVRIERPSHNSVAFDMPSNQMPFGNLILSPVDLPPVTPAIVTSDTEIADAPSTPLPGKEVVFDLGGGLLTVRPLIVLRTLPLIGNGGAIIDYAVGQRAINSLEGGVTYQVWLSPAASPVILQRLRHDGVAIGEVTTSSARLGALDHSGIALAYAVALIVSPIAALLAIGTVLFVIVSDGRRRRREFTSLSLSGVSVRTIRNANLLENAIVLGLALIIGAIIGFVTTTLALSSLPEFVNGTGGLVISRSVPLAPFLGAVGVLALCLALAVGLSTRLVLRGSRARHHSGLEQ